MGSVDVVVPCYRYGHFLRECVESVLSQSIPNVRVLIIDDASPDNTAEVAAELVREDPRVTFIRHSVNKGHIATYNEGLLEWASAEYSLLLSADDYILPGALSRAADLMDAYPEVGLTFGNVIELRDGEAKVPVKSIAEAGTKSNRRILKGPEFIEMNGANAMLIETCTAVVRTALQQRLGGYRPELPHAGDIEMWLRLAANASVGFLSAYQGVYRRHNANMSTACYYYSADGRFIYTTNGRMADLQQRKAAFDYFFETCSDRLPNPERLRRELFRSLSLIAVGRASGAFNEGEVQASQQLAEFAICAYPQIKTSLAWMKLMCKRRMGSKAWRVLETAVARIRGEPIDQR
jgi:glycosyltransferase involved in cell wall biosynthesis